MLHTVCGRNACLQNTCCDVVMCGETLRWCAVSSFADRQPQSRNIGVTETGQAVDNEVGDDGDGGDDDGYDGDGDGDGDDNDDDDDDDGDDANY
jgi:hypothetical protein